MMKQFILTVFISMAWPCTVGSAELESVLGSDVMVFKGNTSTVIEYCPDNTCERFMAAGVAPQSALHDFAFLYLFAVSGYQYLNSFQTTPSSPEVASVLQRHRITCPQSQHREAALCVVQHLAQKHKIEVKAIRYDEHKRLEEPILLPRAK